MPETFHPFPSLPAELRLAIWKIAVRPGGKTLPGVHFFGIVIPGEDGDAGSLIDEAVTLSRRRQYHNYELVGPRWMTVSTEDRFVGIKREPTDNNPSTYLIDCRLLLACKESRQVIKRALSPFCWRKPLIYNNNAQRPKNAKGRFITINFVYVLDRFLDDSFSASIQNIAIDYIPQWGIDVEDAEGDHAFLQIVNQVFHLAISTTSLSELESVWFIDYRIKRRHHAPTKEQSEAPLGKVFYQDGRRLVEVDIECEGSPWELSYEVAEDKWTSCKAFVLALQ
ncbi:hypothetical protein LCI18_008388 [Fusarium solani-melongenae]|uniref:Uncharacterized protein n=1 Tax=Fusarium solani subsp. cucurbitae TaxID=2747967 RepID=A0ACD3Z8Q9_FUSSC|nr:hypothetical protein LCI18_008388 [Fusarium solani-melongenae]